jgi:putative membrane-bound dehydrogenase-like protein
MIRLRRCCLCFFLLLAVRLPAAHAQREYGFDNTKSSGQPYLSPEESCRRLKVPPEYEVTVFAAEPDIINPIAFTIDERGRLWVVENFEYPRRTPKGQKPRDRIKILEDTTGAGKADKVTVWAEGKTLPIGWDLASGIEVGHGGVFLGAAPYLFFLRDTRGTGKCDSQQILLSGFGSQDTHETLNTFTWGPDGLLYGLHGIFTQSKVGEVRLNAAVWRYDVPRKQFGVFAEGTSNPWGLDFDQHGQMFICACVIPHAYHMVGGGYYRRQAGQGSRPFAFGELKEICDHIFHKESGWAHAGALVLQGSHVPEAYQNSLLMGSIHGCSVKRNVLSERGSTFLAKKAPDFLVSGDKNFRPINMRWGPDGAIYLIDWHDQNNCHQSRPDSWDQTHGRIFRIQRKDAKKRPPVDLAKESSAELVELLKNDNPWWYRTALRLLHERRDRSIADVLKKMAAESDNAAHALRGLWGLYAVGAFDEAFAEKMLNHKSPWVRSWSVRLSGEAGKVSARMFDRFTKLAETDPAPQVRLQLASTAQQLRKQNTLPLLHRLLKHKEDANDPDLPLMIWLAYEPQVAEQRQAALDWLRDNAPGNPLVTQEMVHRVVWRLAATGKADDLAACVAFLGQVRDSTIRRRALEGLVNGLKDRQTEPPSQWAAVFPELLRDGDAQVRQLAQRLAVNFRDVAAVRRAMQVVADTGKSADERLTALRDLAIAHPPEARRLFLDLLTRDRHEAIRREACLALSAYADKDIPKTVLASWKGYSPGVRGETVNLLSGRKEWARQLLAAVGDKRVPRTDLTDNTILRIRAFKDGRLNEQIETVWGKFRDTPDELSALIDKMRRKLSEGGASFARGRLVFETQCAKCHKFDGKGHDVGPNLDGASRDIEYLLVNVLDPNRVVGQPYFMRTVELKNGRIETGLLAGEDEQSVTLKGENDVLKVIQKKDIEGKVLVSTKSVMPEGLANNMTEQDFRDLIRYLMASPFLTEVAVAGPYHAEAEETFARRILDGQEAIGSTIILWERPRVGPPGRIPLPASKGKGVSFVTAEMKAPAAMRTRLQLGAAHPVKAWLNGKLVYDGTPGKGQPDEAAVEVPLRAGVNRLLFAVRYQGEGTGLYARLLDPERKLTQGK